MNELRDDLILLPKGYVGNHALVQSQFPKTTIFPLSKIFKNSTIPLNHVITQNPKTQTLNQIIKNK